MNAEIVLLLLAAAVQSGTPILYATLGEIFTERSGVLNLGVEGIMIVGALGGFVSSLALNNPWLGFLCAGLAGSLFAAIHGLVCLVFQGNQVVSGLALTILGTGLANYLGTPLVGMTGPGFDTMPVPFLADITIIGPIFFQHNPLVYFTYVLPPLLWLFLFATRAGLRLRAAGEYPAAATAAGISVFVQRWLGILVGGFLMGLGGGYLSLAHTHLWTNNLTGGRGWIAVALVIFAFWRPQRAIFGAYLFGGIMALQLRLQATGTQLPSSLLLMLPYSLTVFVLVLTSWRRGRSEEPGALGVNVEPVD